VSFPAVVFLTESVQLEQRKEYPVGTINLRPEGLIGYMADMAMVPIMYLLSGTLESPQRTHRWNNTRLKSDAVAHLDRAQMVHCERIPNAMRRINPFFHLPILGGWPDYVVVEPEYGWNRRLRWHVGWVANDGAAGVSRIPIVGPVRMLVGPGDVDFFGILAGHGIQVVLCLIGTGRIGEGGQWAQTPLL
jgi:hypothetical protein